MGKLSSSRMLEAFQIEMFRFLFPPCDRDALVRLERNDMEFSDLKAYGAAIKNIEIYNKVGIPNVVFPCPDTLIDILSDFILALQEVEAAIVFCHREDGAKFSVRSENPAIHAGHLIHNALQGYGDGGGHAEMAGGMIRKENVYLWGKYPKNSVRELFLRSL